VSRTVDLLPLRLEGDVLTGAPTDERLRSLRIELPRLPLSLLVETPERFELSLLLLRLEDPLKLLRLDEELLWLLLLRLDDDELWLLPPRLPPPRCA